MNKFAFESTKSINNAFALYQHGKLTDALLMCQNLINNGESKLDALNLAGIITDKLNRKEEAINYFRLASQLSPDNPQILTNLASTLIEVKKIKEAKEVLLVVTQESSNYADAFYNLGNIFLLEEQLHNARSSYERTLNLNSKHIRALNNLAIVNKKLGDIDAAINTYQQAINLNSSFSEALEGLGAIYYEQKNYELAEQLLLKAIEHNPKLANANFLLGSLYLDQQKDADKAFPFLKNAYSLLSRDANISNMLGRAYYQRGDLQSAKSLLLESLEYDSHQISSCNFLGQIFQELRDYERGEFYFKTALELDTENSAIMNNYGHFLREKGDTTKSIESLNKAISFEKELPIKDRSIAINNLSLTQLLIGDFANGWDNYRFRPSIMDSKLEPCPNKHTISLQNKRILWIRDQGIGDELFFLRFVPLLANLNSTNTYQSSRKLYQIVNDIEFFDSIFTHDYNAGEYDYVFSIGDLPYLINHIKKEDTPPPIKLNSDNILLEEIRGLLTQFGPPPYIGITWKAGRLLENKRIGAYHKHIELSELSKIIAPLSGTIVSLQVNVDRKDLELLSSNLKRPILDVSPYHNQLDKMLCLLDLLDYYFAVSNTYVHMRESLNKTSHVFVNSPPEWRWLREGDHSFWFPNSFAYRQSIEGTWDNAVSQCKQKVFSEL